MRKVERVRPVTPRVKPKKKVAAYARVSMETERLMHSLSAQVSHYSKYIQKNPEWEYAGVYSDDGISGTGTKKRKGFQQLIADAEDGKIDIILTKSISRFARNTVDLLETVRHLKDKGIEVRFEREHISSMSSEGELMLTILASFAQEESRSISENVKWGMQKRFQQGIPNGHFRIFGYRWEGDMLVIVPEEAKIVKRIFQNFLDGKSRLETEREFAAEGIRTGNGCRWVDSNLKIVLTNITYTGNLLLQKEFTTDPIQKHRKKNRGELPQYYVQDTHEAIIDKVTFDYVQKEMARRREMGAIANKSIPTTCFTGKLVCGMCGRHFYHSVSRKNKAGIPYEIWLCASRKEGKPCGQRKYIPDKILREVSADVLGLTEFDENVFLARVKNVLVPEPNELVFQFYDGRQMQRHWASTAKKDWWTPQRRAAVSEARRKKALRRKEMTCFTSKIKCEHCGWNFRHQKEAKISYWRCAKPHHDCGTVGLREDRLKSMIAEVLGLTEFDEQVFLEEMEEIRVKSAEHIVFCFKDGRQVERIWNTAREGHPASAAAKQNMSISQKRQWTSERRQKMSEYMKKLRKERGKAWRKEE